MMNPLTSHAQFHSISIVIYQEIMHGIFTTLSPCAEEPEEKDFNGIIVLQSILRTQPLVYFTLHVKSLLFCVYHDIYVLLA